MRERESKKESIAFHFNRESFFPPQRLSALNSLQHTTEPRCLRNTSLSFFALGKNEEIIESFSLSLTFPLPQHTNNSRTAFLGVLVCESVKLMQKSWIFVDKKNV